MKMKINAEELSKRSTENIPNLEENIEKLSKEVLEVTDKQLMKASGQGRFGAELHVQTNYHEFQSYVIDYVAKHYKDLSLTVGTPYASITDGRVNTIPVIW